jgi:hypothetical protein
MHRTRLMLEALALGIGLAGCEGPTTYHPAGISADPGDRTGYWVPASKPTASGCPSPETA